MPFKKFLPTLLVLLGSLALLAWAPFARAAAEPRLALLIGNAAYRNSPLRNPVNDVRLMETVLKESGFTVIKAENASMRDMRRLVRDFGDRLKAEGGVGLFYFSGHGVQVRGDNYLVSLDSDIRNEDEVPDDALNSNLVLEKMQSAGNRVNIVILDACRNNPFPVKLRSATSGLAGIQAPSGSLVAYATAPGAVAADGTGRNSPYTASLARAMRQPGLAIEEVFKQVRTAVRRETNNQQTPWENTALEGQFFFRESAQAAGRMDPAAMDLAFWESVKTSNYAADLQAYMAQFPNGVFTQLAKARVEQLKTSGPSSLPGSVLLPKVLGVLEINDIYSGLVKQRLDVVVTPSPAGRTVYSSGDIISSKGEILQIRMGEQVLRVKSGALWGVPLRGRASGRAAVAEVDDNSNAPGSVEWTAVPLSGDKIRVDAKVSYGTRYGWGGASQINAFGEWTAVYSEGRELPDSSSALIKTRDTAKNVASTVIRWR